jgi:hypothetical protein
MTSDCSTAARHSGSPCPLRARAIAFDDTQPFAHDHQEFGSSRRYRKEIAIYPIGRAYG